MGYKNLPPKVNFRRMVLRLQVSHTGSVKCSGKLGEWWSSAVVVVPPATR